MNDSKQQLAQTTQDKQKYGKLLEGLIAQGVCQLLEPKIQVRCRQVDQQLVQSVIEPALASVKDKIKMETEVTLDTTNFLPADRYVKLILIFEMLNSKSQIKGNSALVTKDSLIAFQKFIVVISMY